jgi:hypothetical protein
MASVLAATVRVVNEIARPRPLRESFAKRLKNKRSIDLLAEGIPYDPSGEEIQDHRQVQPALQRYEIRDVRDPSGVGSIHGEISHQDVRRHREAVLRVRRGSETTLSASLQAQLPHQASHPLAGDAMTVLAKIAQNPRASVRPAAPGMRRRDLDP